MRVLVTCDCEYGNATHIERVLGAELPGAAQWNGGDLVVIHGGRVGFDAVVNAWAWGARHVNRSVTILSFPRRVRQDGGRTDALHAHRLVVDARPDRVIAFVSRARESLVVQLARACGVRVDLHQIARPRAPRFA